jgi:DNA polymerase-3 subunit delta'
MKFSEVHGLADIKKKLLQNFRLNRLAHAQLFLGPEGSGNLAMALALTQLIYCQDPTEDDSCGICSSCQKIGKFMHPDVHFSFPSISTPGSKPSTSDDFIKQWREILTETPYFNETDWVQKISDNENKQLNITAKETLEIVKKLSLKAYEGKAKTLIIWLPEHLRNESNKLLKIIEEPPQKTYFILVASNYDSLLPTITSRTQLVKSPAYTELEVADFLGKKYHLDHQKAESLAFLAEGNLNSATKLVESVEDNYAQLFREWMLACYGNKIKDVGRITDDIAKLGRTQIQLFLKNGLKILRESLLYKTIDDYEIKFEGEYKDFIRKFSNTINAQLVEKSYEQINETIYHVQRNANAKISLFNLSLGLRQNFIRKK